MPRSATTHALPILEERGVTALPVDSASLVHELASLIEGEVRTDHHDRMLYSTDASIYQVEPLGVVIPRSIDDVRATVQFALHHHLPLLPRGGGTSLAGQAVNRALVIDFSAYVNRIINIDPDARTAKVEPGVVLDDLNAAAARHGLTFGPDVATAAHANIGGMIGNNSAGAHSILYGRTVEHLTGLDVLLADGRELRFDCGAAERDPRVKALTERVIAVIEPLADEIDARFPRLRRHVDGYNLDLVLRQWRDSTPGTFDQVNLAHLFCGSEGTLGVTLSATLGLVDAPRVRGLAIVPFPNVDAALNALHDILATRPAAVELVDDMIIELARQNTEHRRYVELLPRLDGKSPGAVLYVEYYAGDDGELDAQHHQLASLWPDREVPWYTTQTEMNNAWKLRRAGEPLLHGLPGRRKPVTIIEDLAVEPERLAAFVRDLDAMFKRYGTHAAYYAHASVGCLHIRPLVDLHDPDDQQRMEDIAHEAAQLVRRYEGALSGEHGDGRARSALLEDYFGRNICRAFREIKAIFDPEGRMNPGIITEPAGLREHLRVQPDRQMITVPQVDTYYRYGPEHGLEEAVWRCNGAGVCRRMSGGTMCPSYRATRDERHATRGRGNALRLAITGQSGLNVGQARWDDEGTLETLDLCLSCKACKSECPSNVDIAKLKSEYLAQTYDQRGGPPMRSRFFANVRTLGRLGSIAPGPANWLTNFPLIQAMMKRALGLHPDRTLPRFSRSLYAWRRRRGVSAPPDAPCVVYQPDCFSVYHEASIGRAAVRVLEALGYRVLLPPVGCCQRPAISLGLLRQALPRASSTAHQLLMVLDRARPVAIVGTEPSCVSAIIDDWCDLKLNVAPESVQRLGSITQSIESFIEQRWNDHPRRPDQLRLADKTQTLLHGHCHQKALWGIDDTASLLRRIEGLEVRTPETGCCGMAGAFGYARDHYDVSMRAGEQSVFGPVRDATDAIIAAPGTSCRQQIMDGTGRCARHPIEILAEAFGDDAPDRR